VADRFEPRGPVSAAYGLRDSRLLNNFLSLGGGLVNYYGKAPAIASG